VHRARREMRELASMILKEQAPVGPWPQLKFNRDAPNGPCVYRVGDPTRLKTIYKPQISIEQGIRRALDS
jgi:nucleoside-diphosphate-sugar epimerase